MKGLYVVGLIVLFLLMPLAVYPASIDGAETLGQERFEIGVENEVVFDRDIKAKTYSISDSWSGDVTVYYGDAEIDITGATIDYVYSETDRPDIDKLYRPVVKATYGLYDNLDLYIKLGAADGETKGGSLHAELNGSATNVSIDGVDYGAAAVGLTLDATRKYELKYAFLFGIGLKGTYPLEKGWLLGLDASYLHHRNSYTGKINFALTGDITAVDEVSFTGKMTFQEWQFAPYIAKKLDKIIPYLGVKYSKLTLTDDYENQKDKYRSDDNFGVFLGTDYKLNDSWSFNLEGRFVDETAMSFAAKYKF